MKQFAPDSGSTGKPVPKPLPRMNEPTAQEMMDFIQKNEATLSHATSEPAARRWRCHVWERHFASPDIRERSERTGFGKTAKEAVRKAMLPTAIPNAAASPIIRP